MTALLAQGTKLVARLQYEVSSAAKVPVVAVIEYNYEQHGDLVIPAGTKAYGTLSQVTPQGWVTIKFDALEYPNGEQEKINGSSLSMEQGVLKGVVNGKNSGKRFLTRTLTGIGTIAAFAVGGRGLGGQVDNSILLRERLSSNVAMAGEQELAMLAFQQNIVVTVPANTRFYLVLNEPGVSAPASSKGTTAPAGEQGSFWPRGSADDRNWKRLERISIRGDVPAGNSGTDLYPERNAGDEPAHQDAKSPKCSPARTRELVRR